jgi:hypothetical protein
MINLDLDKPVEKTDKSNRSLKNQNKLHHENNVEMSCWLALLKEFYI